MLAQNKKIEELNRMISEIESTSRDSIEKLLTELEKEYQKQCTFRIGDRVRVVEYVLRSSFIETDIRDAKDTFRQVWIVKGIIDDETLEITEEGGSGSFLTIVPKDRLEKINKK